MTIYEGDQQQTAYAIVNRIVAAQSPAQIKAAQPASSTTYQFTASYTFHYPATGTGSPLSFRKGVAYSLDPALKAALLAAGAPMVAS
jgi:hypothetical protein